ncbi:hypothetical protein E2562_013381 [Oryza meyeriana var. granulata]|uniref:Uncharacterized protein n=1 Tax=Oryza meyeriana var. granulata TaxID=110450 RepID=A0A6G1CG55_9ORYZ|nr:hypothetical protein E2562_013381 [Oryza meyeriana var. granulata]
MHAAGAYKSLMMYVEACGEGLLPTDIAVYATTESNAEESNWGTYCPGDGQGTPPAEFDTCLRDLYSVAWMDLERLAGNHHELLGEGDADLAGVVLLLRHAHEALGVGAPVGAHRVVELVLARRLSAQRLERRIAAPPMRNRVLVTSIGRLLPM